MKLAKEVFGNKLRVRVSGLAYKGDSLLLINHNIDGSTLWAPPGGGVEFGESVVDTLIREFKEETGLDVVPGQFLFFTEYINPPLHAIELFYQIESYKGALIGGNDPEFKDYNILVDIKFINHLELKNIPLEQLHNTLKNCNNPIELLDKRGHLK